MPSPRDVPTYDLKPEMSAPEAAARVRRALARAAARGPARSASGSSTSPTPTWSATPASIAGGHARGRDRRPLPRRGGRGGASTTGGALIVTADHGNADEMLEPDGSPDTAHSTQPGAALVTTVEGVALARPAASCADVRRRRWSCWASRSRPADERAGSLDPLGDFSGGYSRRLRCRSGRAGRRSGRRSRSLTTRSKSLGLRAVEVQRSRARRRSSRSAGTGTAARGSA